MTPRRVPAARTAPFRHVPVASVRLAMNGRLVSSVPKKPRSRVNAARVRTPPRAALSAMVHLEETEPAPERASEDACASGDASDAGYAQRIDKEWRDQLASARDANAGLDENDVDARELYGEQAVHNFPDVHEDWGDAKAKAARAARMRAVAEMSPDGKEGLERTGWNTAYRAGLESALDAVRDSKTMMANLRQIRSRQKDIDDGVEIGHLKGKTAKEANAEWEKQRLEARDAERRRRAAAATLAAKQKAGDPTSSDFGERFGLPSLPDFLKRSSLDVGDDEGAEAAARALAEKHGEWIRTLDGGNPMAKEETRAIANEAEAEAAEAKEEKKTNASVVPGPSPDEPRAAAELDPADASFETSDLPEDTSFFENLTSLSPLRRAARAKTDRDEDFWNKEMWGGDDFDADGEVESAEAEMARLCALEISSARTLSVSEE